LTEVVASYHYSVVKVLLTKRAGFYPHRHRLSRLRQTKTPMFLPTSARQTAKPFAKLRVRQACVSDARRSYSVVNDLPWGTRSV